MKGGGAWGCWVSVAWFGEVGRAYVWSGFFFGLLVGVRDSPICLCQGRGEVEWGMVLLGECGVVR